MAIRDVHDIAIRAVISPQESDIVSVAAICFATTDFCFGRTRPAVQLVCVLSRWDVFRITYIVEAIVEKYPFWVFYYFAQSWVFLGILFFILKYPFKISK